MTEPTLEKRYLETLIQIFLGGPAGIEAISHVMQVSPEILVEEVEPSLLASKIIYRTTRGRCATPKAFEMLELPAPKWNPDAQFPFHPDV
jgi:holliday junction DNA helicase RuvB